jgi:hypothetical protein
MIALVGSILALVCMVLVVIQHIRLELQVRELERYYGIRK